ncbi:MULTISPECIES: glycosyltransferase family 39 protein [Streptomycetaceae]|uniref:Glycosyltransferase RgtA/B/C/D-like domain-containing protein n=1 Tax=Streptantibioticus cattleyicolor (strain ATCC 35852 / DSM 46488 / JCM 4925 / NBRC 14057 / NRRL 8057) TaxID=1003195 RepID=F8JWP6_STREN|nr:MULTISPECIES: glycosyltransferase family 39 protein [Streptomycetaceae]AEW97043.1 hypothetical protein SCATT_46720 [Streptantibioticus cattleyicolor NRRL 8057 = DSM 46488]MYS61509.1 glycosyltransferase [Streptomyces sp. SID5468]CCB77369.1 conserved membrane protein of unknown function [Streptantibioticus cattleyicolor NRRL 8057 = DSM 46488]
MPAAPQTSRRAALPGQRGTAPGRQAARGAARRGRWWPALLVPLAVAVTHLPSFLRPLWNPDEGFLAVQARLLAHGGVLYDTVVDRKPPLLPWLYQGLLGLFGDGSLWPVRVAALVAHTVTATLLASIARRRWGRRAGLAAGLGYALGSIGLAPEDTQAATFEVFMLPWTVAAVAAAERRRWALAGLAVAGAALTKQTGGAVLLPVAWLLWRGGGKRLPGALRLAAGFAVPIAAVACALGPGPMLFWTVTGSGSYASAAGAVATAVGRALGNAGLLLAACAGFAVPVGWLLPRRRRPAGTSGLWVWLGASALAVVTGFQFFGHYYLQLLPPLVLLGVAALRELPRLRRPAAAWTLLAAAGCLAWGLAAPHAELDHARRVAAAVRARTGPDDPVLVWGMHPEDYWLARRTPASRYLTAGFLTNFSGGHGGARVGERYAVPGAWDVFRAEVRRRPPALVVDDSRGAPYAPARTPSLRALLASGYHRVATVDGAVVYARG